MPTMEGDSSNLNVVVMQAILTVLLTGLLYWINKLYQNNTIWFIISYVFLIGMGSVLLLVVFVDIGSHKLEKNEYLNFINN